MASEGPGRFVSYEKSRTLIYISKKVADDSAFPFRPGEELWVKIDGKRVVIEKAKSR